MPCNDRYSKGDNRDELWKAWQGIQYNLGQEMGGEDRELVWGIRDLEI